MDRSKKSNKIYAHLRVERGDNAHTKRNRRGNLIPNNVITYNRITVRGQMML